MSEPRTTSSYTDTNIPRLQAWNPGLEAQLFLNPTFESLSHFHLFKTPSETDNLPTCRIQQPRENVALPLVPLSLTSKGLSVLLDCRGQSTGVPSPGSVRVRSRALRVSGNVLVLFQYLIWGYESNPINNRRSISGHPIQNGDCGVRTQRSQRHLVSCKRPILLRKAHRIFLLY